MVAVVLLVALALIAPSEKGSLILIDDITSNGSSRMNKILMQIWCNYWKQGICNQVLSVCYLSLCICLPKTGCSDTKRFACFMLFNTSICIYQEITAEILNSSLISIYWCQSQMFFVNWMNWPCHSNSFKWDCRRGWSD